MVTIPVIVSFACVIVKVLLSTNLATESCCGVGGFTLLVFVEIRVPDMRPLANASSNVRLSNVTGL